VGRELQQGHGQGACESVVLRLAAWDKGADDSEVSIVDEEDERGGPVHRA
jgi:hypothetical protein